mgnify:CR=1 FL=1
MSSWLDSRPQHNGGHRPANRRWLTCAPPLHHRNRGRPPSQCGRRPTSTGQQRVPCTRPTLLTWPCQLNGTWEIIHQVSISKLSLFPAPPPIPGRARCGAIKGPLQEQWIKTCGIRKPSKTWWSSWQLQMQEPLRPRWSTSHLLPQWALRQCLSRPLHHPGVPHNQVDCRVKIESPRSGHVISWVLSMGTSRLRPQRHPLLYHRKPLRLTHWTGHLGLIKST